MLTFSLAAVLAAAHLVGTAERWRCDIHPLDDTSGQITYIFDVWEDRVVRSPDDYSNRPLVFETTTYTPELVVGVNRKEKIGLTLRRAKGEILITANRRPNGWDDPWVGPCNKL